MPAPAYRYETVAARLQQWLIEIRLAYLGSGAFDQDTVLISPDTLLMGPVDAGFRRQVDLSILVRAGDRFQGWKQILNTAQWWRRASKDALVGFYAQAAEVGAALPEPYQLWGGDTEALYRLLAPVRVGTVHRAGLRVQMVPAPELFRSLSAVDIRQLQAGRVPGRPGVPLLDFKYHRKAHMRSAFQALFPAAVPA